MIVKCNLCRCMVTTVEADAARQICDIGHTLCPRCASGIDRPVVEDDPPTEQEDWEEHAWERVADMEQTDE